MSIFLKHTIPTIFMWFFWKKCHLKDNTAVTLIITLLENILVQQLENKKRHTGWNLDFSHRFLIRKIETLLGGVTREINKL